MINVPLQYWMWFPNNLSFRISHNPINVIPLHGSATSLWEVRVAMGMPFLHIKFLGWARFKILVRTSLPVQADTYRTKLDGTRSACGRTVHLLLLLRSLTLAHLSSSAHSCLQGNRAEPRARAFSPPPSSSSVRSAPKLIHVLVLARTGKNRLYCPVQIIFLSQVITLWLSSNQLVSTIEW